MIKRIALISFILGLSATTNNVVVAAATCTVNGREVSCAQATKFFGWGIGALLTIFALTICATIFWILMIIHAATHEIKDRPMWIILMVFTGIIGALIYYFVVKRVSSSQPSGNLPS